MKLDLKHFWYIVAESSELTANKVLSRQVCDEWLVCYRDKAGKATVLRDRCLHRCGRLSAGSVQQGELTCPYHGWVYGEAGRVIAMPSLGEHPKPGLKARAYTVREQDGYIYVRLMEGPADIQPFPMQYFKKPGWKNVRLQNYFHNTVVNCVENFIDIPHTAFVHTGIFRSSRNESLTASIIRTQGQVRVKYENERQNLGTFNWFLNPKGKTITHTDDYYMPNITCVTYSLKSKWQYVITSQSIPVNANETRVYTELSYQFGIWTPFLAWIIKRQGQKVIDQDVTVLNQQMEVIKKYGEHFYNTPSDQIHEYVHEIYHALQAGEDPRLLPEQQKEVTFWV